MTDLLIKLYDLPEVAAHLAGVRKRGVVVRRARAYEKFRVLEVIAIQGSSPGYYEDRLR